jgi:hypothetical protein
MSTYTLLFFIALGITGLAGAVLLVIMIRSYVCGLYQNIRADGFNHLNLAMLVFTVVVVLLFAHLLLYFTALADPAPADL